MKYIRKTSEPRLLAGFKTQVNTNNQATYESLTNKYPKKTRKLRNHLISEQGHTCCYCGVSIIEADSHIEHFKPQRKFPHLDLDYFNLLVSCQRELEPREPRSCGMAKNEWFDDKLLVSPLIINCEDFFEYTRNGQILPTSQLDKSQTAKETIERLCLNIDLLQEKRKRVIDVIFSVELSGDDIEKLIHAYTQLDENGKHSSYCQAIIYLLKQEKMYRNF